MRVMRVTRANQQHSSYASFASVPKKRLEKKTKNLSFGNRSHITNEPRINQINNITNHGCRQNSIYIDSIYNRVTNRLSPGE